MKKQILSVISVVLVIVFLFASTAFAAEDPITEVPDSTPDEVVNEAEQVAEKPEEIPDSNLLLAPAVSGEDAVARIGETYYASLEDAVTAAKKSSQDKIIIYLLRDAECGSIETGNKNIAFRPEGKDVCVTLTGTMYIGSDQGQAAVGFMPGENNETLCFTPKKNENNENSFRPIEIRSGYTLEMFDGVYLISSEYFNSAGENGGGGFILVRNGAKFAMFGGKIQGSTVKSSNTDYENCREGRGGAVYVCEGGTFDMSGGEIQNCHASVAGGAVFSRGTVNISGTANIYECSALGLIYCPRSEQIDKAEGGAFYLLDGEMTMDGGKIIKNVCANGQQMHGAGIFVGQKAALTLGGPVVVSQNGEGSVSDNVYLCNNKVINISGFGKSSIVGITTETEPGVSAPVQITSNGSQSDLSYLVPDSDIYEVVYNNVGGYFELAQSDFFAVQPADQTEIECPDGAVYTVAAKNPENVASYQWLFYDNENQLFVLEGTSAKTDTLVIPSSEENLGECKVQCAVTDKDGNIHKSRRALFNVLDPVEDLTCLYVDSYVLLPGASIDLENPAKGKSYEESAPSLGTGIISLSEDGNTVTFDNVDMDNNDKVIFDRTISPAISIAYRTKNNSKPDISLNLIGENKILNKFYQEETNGCGIPVDFYAVGKADAPVLTITGSGSLDVTGGTYLVRHNGPVTVDAPLVFHQYEDHFCDGIHAARGFHKQIVDDVEEIVYDNTDITFTKNAVVTGEINGTLAYAPSGIFMQPGSKIDIESSAPSVGAGDTAKNVFYSKKIDIDNAELKLDMYADPDRFDPLSGLAVAAFTGIEVLENGSLNIKDSNVCVDYTTGENKEEWTQRGLSFISIANGIAAGTNADVNIENSTVKVNIDSKAATESRALSGGSNLFVTDSTVNVSDKTRGMVHGIYFRDDIEITDSKVDCFADAYESDARFFDPASRGIVCEGSIFIDLDSKDEYVKAESKKGLAFGVDYESKGDEPIDYDPSYTPEYISFGGRAEITTPADSKISCASRPNLDNYYYSETVYDLNDTSKPADKVVIECLPEIYTVSFETNGGSAVPSQQVPDGGKVVRPADPVKAGFDFAGWYSDSTLTTLYDFDMEVDDATGDFTIYAKWNPISKIYTVSFETNGGSAVPSQQVPDGGKVVRPADPVKTGFDFAGWYSDVTLTTLYDFDMEVDEAIGNFTIYAKWNPISKIYTFTGSGTVVNLKEKKDAVFTSNAQYSKFVRVDVDGKTLDTKNYTIKEGSTIVTLKYDYLKTLANGKHTIAIISTDGKAEGEFTIVNSTAGPKTGDESNLAGLAAVILAAGAVIAVTAVFLARKKSAVK